MRPESVFNLHRLHRIPSAVVPSKITNETIDYDLRIDRPKFRLVSCCGTVAYDCQKRLMKLTENHPRTDRALKVQRWCRFWCMQVAHAI